ncbi:major capsid protein [Schlesneria sp. DSM 10557]|uniref:major capsid protein n=1 Tax=Schlesneria sp. DSM 10557 TaxID=3044399 RepID=UPI0035A0852C
MPTYPTLLDMAKRNGRDRAVPLISETSKWIPEISGKNWDGSTLPGVGSVRTIKGINYKTLVRTGNPTVGFRDGNTGANISAGTYENRLVETFIFNPRWEVDKAVADRSEDGPDAYIADEAMGIMEASMQLLGSQFFYGRLIDGKGFPGLVDAIQAEFTVDATGTGNTCGSVWAVKFGVADVQWIYGENGALAIPDKTVETVYRADPGTTTPLKPMKAYVQDLLAYPGVQVGSTRSIGRIKNIKDEANKRLTDALLYQLLTKMKVRPDVLFMPKTVLEQLRASRTTFSPTGLPAPTPNSFEGIPIAPTESLTMTETAS